MQEKSIKIQQLHFLILFSFIGKVFSRQATTTLEITLLWMFTILISLLFLYVLILVLLFNFHSTFRNEVISFFCGHRDRSAILELGNITSEQNYEDDLPPSYEELEKGLPTYESCQIAKIPNVELEDGLPTYESSQMAKISDKDSNA